MACVFCKIVKKEISASVVFEDEDVLAFKDANPIAPVHILIIPKRHIESISNLKEGDARLAGKLILTARALASEFDISSKGYKLLFRVGEWGGQEVPHIHLHLIGGAKLTENINSVI